MIFSSFVFLFQFLPIFLLIYFLIPDRWKNIVLFSGSLIFYFYGVREHPAYLLLILLSILVNYVAALRMEHGSSRIEKIWLFIGMFYNIGSLFLFKYFHFFCENVNLFLSAAGSEKIFPDIHLILPIGISFYTFQISSYLIDVYRKKFPAEHSFITLGTYLCLFPQLIAGPIVTYSAVRRQLHDRTHSLQNMEEGMKEFTIGLALKVLIANRVGSVWSQASAIGYESISTPMAWLALFAYSLQIYFDFYGYSLMAKGLGTMLGFTFPDNFHNPYLSRTVSAFWRRWHITLGQWFRDYVYIPLGGNRKHLLRNLLIVWLFTGLWHGASWNFVFWGLFSFLLIVLEKNFYGSFLEQKPLLGHIYMMIFILFSWLLFGISDMTQLHTYFLKLFPFFHNRLTVVFKGDFIKNLRHCALPLLTGFFCCTGIPRKVYEKHKNRFYTALFLVVLFWLCVYSMYLGLDDPFLYYQF